MNTYQLTLDDIPPSKPEGPTYDEIQQSTFGPEGPATISVTKAAKLLGISRTTAYEAVRDGSLPAIRVRRRIVIPMAWLVDLLHGRTPGR